MPAREFAWKRRWWNGEIYLLLPGEQTCNLSERLVSKPRHYNLRLCREQTGTKPKTRGGESAGRRESLARVEEVERGGQQPRTLLARTRIDRDWNIRERLSIHDWRGVSAARPSRRWIPHEGHESNGESIAKLPPAMKRRPSESLSRRAAFLEVTSRLNVCRTLMRRSVKTVLYMEKVSGLADIQLVVSTR